MNLSRAQSLLIDVQSAFEQAVQRTAIRCASGGNLDAERLDRHQGICFELAWCQAELLASKSVLANADTASVDGGLALAFVCEALSNVLARLQTIYLAVELDRASLHAAIASAEFASLRREAASPEVLARLGREVASTDEIAQVEVDDQTAIAREAFRRMAIEAVAPIAASIHRDDLIVPESLLRSMREMGAFGLSIPEEYGGSAPSGRDNTTMMIAVSEALSEASIAAAGSLITRPEILSRALLSGGTEAQKRRWLPRIAAGEPLCAIAITEPDHGSDVGSLSMRATKTEGGWLLNGAKTWCTFAGKAGVLMVVARTNPDGSMRHRGLSVLLAEKPSYEGHEFEYVQSDGGKLTGRAIATIGYRGMHSFDLAFEDFFVPDENVIGGSAGLGNGFYLTMAGMVGGRIQTASRALGVMRAAIRSAVRYAHDRKVFGKALIEYQLTQIRIAQMTARFAACRQLAYAVSRQLDSGKDAARTEASLVKLLACRYAELVTRDAQQMYGGMGYAEESPVSRYFLDARVLSIFEGTEETLALKVIARAMLEASLPS